MTDLVKWEVSKRLEAAAKALESNGFNVFIFETKENAAKRILEEAAGAETIGFGGSLSLVEMDLPAALAGAGKTCLIHSLPTLTHDERLEIMRRQLTCDLFLTGTNAVTLDGKLVNIDATGNRVGAMSFGPRKVIAVAGSNKLAGNVEDGISRIRQWAAPPNARRLAVETPCAKTGFCTDCSSPQRICRIVHVMEKRPRMTNIMVFLVSEALGL